VDEREGLEVWKTYGCREVLRGSKVRKSGNRQYASNGFTFAAAGESDDGDHHLGRLYLALGLGGRSGRERERESERSLFSTLFLG
jgi:hypothetical protein